MPGSVVVEAGGAVEFLTGVLVGHIDRRAGHIGACAAIGIVGDRLDFVACPVRDHGTGTEMVLMPVIHRAVADGNRCDACIVGPHIACATAVVAFKEFADVARNRGRACDLLQPRPLPVIDKGRRHAAERNRQRLVLFVVNQILESRCAWECLLNEAGSRVNWKDSNTGRNAVMSDG